MHMGNIGQYAALQRIAFEKCQGHTGNVTTQEKKPHKKKYGNGSTKAKGQRREGINKYGEHWRQKAVATFMEAANNARVSCLW